MPNESCNKERKRKRERERERERGGERCRQFLFFHKIAFLINSSIFACRAILHCVQARIEIQSGNYVNLILTGNLINAVDLRPRWKRSSLVRSLRRKSNLVTSFFAESTARDAPMSYRVAVLMNIINVYLCAILLNHYLLWSA